MNTQLLLTDILIGIVGCFVFYLVTLVRAFIEHIVAMNGLLNAYNRYMMLLMTRFKVEDGLNKAEIDTWFQENFTELTPWQTFIDSLERGGHGRETKPLNDNN